MKYLLLSLAMAGSIALHAQTSTKTQRAHLPGMQATPQDLPYREHQRLLRAGSAETSVVAKTTSGGPGYVFDTTRWAHLVDSTWGAGLPDSNKMKQFNFFWKNLDSIYACFVGLPPYNWDSMVVAIDTEVIHGVSKGRFAAICNNFMRYINDGHSGLHDAIVNYSPIYPGSPVFRGQSGRFGASITTFNDTEALVYAANADHPFGLAPGDIILGYNGVPWRRLVKTILAHQLPNSVYLGSSDAATAHRYIQAAGENWYLFDTINIKKCDGSIVSFPTNLMSGYVFDDFTTEQMQVPGIALLSAQDYYNNGIAISSGVISGKRIGYVYMYDCLDNTGQNLLNAVRVLVEDSAVNGLILDIRTNFGGGFGAYEPTFNYLNNGNTSWVGYGDRYDANRMHMDHNAGPSAWYDVIDDDANFFPYPVALLTGPNAVSAGDLLPILFRKDPYLKVFGKSTAGAYGSSIQVSLPFPGFYASRQAVNFYQTSDPSIYITHREVPVDSNVWFNRDSVCAGIDNIVTTAVRWIEGQTSEVTTIAQHPLNVNIYPNPAGKFVNLSISSPMAETVDIKLYNMLGAVVKEMPYSLLQGSNVVHWDLAEGQLPSGNYYISVQDDKGIKTIRALAIVR